MASGDQVLHRRVHAVFLKLTEVENRLKAIQVMMLTQTDADRLINRIADRVIDELSPLTEIQYGSRLRRKRSLRGRLPPRRC